MSEEIYMIDNAGRLFRKGEHIGDLEGDKLTLKPESKNYQASVTRWLRAEADAAEGKPAAAEFAPVEVLPKVKKLTPAEQEAADNKGIAQEAIGDAKKAREAHRDDEEFAKANGCPPPPKKNPQFGDKSPAYVDWLQKHRPDVFAIRFGVKGRGKVPVIQTNPTTGIDEVTGYRETDMATRKTHLTEKVETHAGLTDDMDWNA